ncbi:MAG: hypothetical protein AMJ88_16895 [Anaerolineae bacterium SM23_ 63]|nr:MAG: hypothetical protein AMJ88_16895 [Anaerolineae bacterium SM23_ 63]
MGGTAVGGIGDGVDVGPSRIGVRVGVGGLVGCVVPAGAHAGMKNVKHRRLISKEKWDLIIFAGNDLRLFSLA